MSFETNAPAVVAAERAILGSILLQESRYHEAADILKPECFSLDAHRLIFRRMGLILDGGQTLDPISLRAELEANDELKRIGNVGYLCSLTEGLPLQFNVRRSAEIVRDSSRRQQLVSTLDGLLTMASDLTNSTDECVAIAQDELLRSSAEGGIRGAERIGSFSAEVYGQIDAQRNGGNREVIGLRTGLRCLDYATTGYRNGELTVMGGCNN